ncbi:MAG: hypothetical protein K2O58_06725 [Bacteroidales bacterium]|nr:hypothetical protein [Bacteroidales bacterium]
MKNCLLPLITISLALAGCDRNSEAWQSILNVENYIEDRPDSALAVLGNIDVEQLSGQAEKAKHAMLLSMALDKNYEDRTDFDILQPAIDWYENHGSPTDRLRTLYYQGRIYQNYGDNEKAMVCFVKALDAGEKSDDIITKARTLVAQGNIYKSLHKFDRMVNANLTASQYFIEAGLVNSHMNCLLRIFNGYSILNEYDQAYHYAEISRGFLGQVGILQESNFYATYLSLLLQNKQEDEVIQQVAEEYINSIPPDLVDWHTISLVNYYLGNYDEAIIDAYRLNRFEVIDRKVRHHAILSQVHQDAGHYKEALEAYHNYISITDSLDFAAFQQDTQFIEERHTLEMRTIEERTKKNYTIFASAFLLILAGGLSIRKSHSLKISRMEKQMADSEAERYRLMCFQMEQERDNLATLLTQKESLDPKVMAAISSRLELLNKFFAAHITDNCEIDKKATRELAERLSDKESFMNLTRLAFAGSKPEFISHLEECGLSEQEINYCCLYAIGLKGKEVGAYIEMRSHYNISSGIREKLGIGEHDTNLGIYIRKLMNGRQSKA